jgi:hypothetical protein
LGGQDETFLHSFKPSRRTAEALAAVRSATTESRDQLRARIDQAQVDLDLASKDAQQKAGEATDRAKIKWAQM